MVRRIDLGRKEGEKGDGKEDGREARQREREKAIDSKLKSSQTSSSSSLSPSLIVRRREMHEHTKEPQHNFPRDRCVCVGRDDTMAGAHYRQPRPFASLGGGLWLLVLLFSFFFIHPGAFIYFPFPADGIAFLTFVRSRCCVDRFLPPSCASAKPVVRAWLIDCIRYPMLRRDTSPLSHRRSGSNRRETQRKITVDTNLRRPVMSPSPNEKMLVI